MKGAMTANGKHVTRYASMKAPPVCMAENVAVTRKLLVKLSSPEKAKRSQRIAATALQSPMTIPAQTRARNELGESVLAVIHTRTSPHKNPLAQRKAL